MSEFYQSPYETPPRDEQNDSRTKRTQIKRMSLSGVEENDDGIDPFGCALGLFIGGGLMIVVIGVLIKFGVIVFRWAIR